MSIYYFVLYLMVDIEIRNICCRVYVQIRVIKSMGIEIKTLKFITA